MHNIHQRFLDICSIGLMAFLVTAVITPASTVLRDAMLQPQAAFSGLRVDASPVAAVSDRTLLYPQTSLPTAAEAARNGYFGGFRSHYITAGGALDANVQVNAAMTAMLREDERQPHRRFHAVLPGAIIADRAFRRMVLKVSGQLDVSRNWDWNTKSIYVSFIARFRAAEETRDVWSEVLFLDCMVRRTPDPPALVARLFDRLHHRYSTRSGSERVGLASVWTPAEQQQYNEYHAALPHQEHDHPSVLVDHARRVLYFNESFKYYVEDFDGGGLLRERPLEVLMRYQVMSYSGWAPVREVALGAAGLIFVAEESHDAHAFQRREGDPQVRVREADMQAPSASVPADG
ncbi:hypothetical protein STCU_04949 [Strigomonas culicis]|uniref:Signal peptidase complex subunit 3 n=1 Tax=Strigomonas culicis TaxID=28005 RepID=S9VNU5_9TRYP|nr:hypothetical protein STCU_04949 [Strigomonas culicis]|eukprot:EPY28651.1 hypothetical protein STCU_04949 [Strigomonas culicis]